MFWWLWQISWFHIHAGSQSPYARCVALKAYLLRFNPGSFGLTAALLLLYGAWILFIKFHTGVYPYGFLNQLPHPKGILITSFGMAMLGTVFFFIGKKISAWSAKVLRADQLEDLDYDPEKKVDSKLA